MYKIIITQPFGFLCAYCVRFSVPSLPCMYKSILSILSIFGCCCCCLSQTLVTYSGSSSPTLSLSLSLCLCSSALLVSCVGVCQPKRQELPFTMAARIKTVLLVLCCAKYKQKKIIYIPYKNRSHIRGNVSIPKVLL